MEQHSTRIKDVYLIRGDYVGSPVKIGTSFDFQHRLQTLQIGSPTPLKIGGIIPFGGSKLEAEIHKQLAPYRLHGEWFKACTEVADFVNQFMVPITHRCSVCQTRLHSWEKILNNYINRSSKYGWLVLPFASQQYITEAIISNQNHIEAHKESANV